MKPINFEYFAPTDLAEALALLRRFGDDAKVLAGGQSLMPLMNRRLVPPKVVIDINRIPGLSHITPIPAGGLHIGALTRQRTLEKSNTVQERSPLVATAMPHIGHFQTRNRGTIGGSMVHADPAAEVPALALALDAELVLRSVGGERTMAAEDFLVSSLATAGEADELLTEIRIPAWDSSWRWGFEELCQRQGDFALVGSAVLLRLNKSKVCEAARITMFGLGERRT